MRYLVKGSYPKYTITGFRDTELVHVDHAKELRHVMDKFVHRLQPGDTIEWVESELQPPAGAWWTEQDGAMPG